MSPILFQNIIFLIFIITSVNLNAQNGWTEPINLSNSPDNELFGYSSAVDKNGVIYVVWSEKPYEFVPRREIWLRKSTDNGVTWSEHEVISDLGDYRMPEIAVDSKGGLHVIYWSNIHYKYFYITSENGWSVAAPISASGTQNGIIVIDKKDTKHFFWTFIGGNIPYVSYRSLADGEFSEPKILSDLSVYSTHSTAIADEDNILHFVYLTISDSTCELIYRKKDDYGWSEAEIVAEDSIDIRDFKITLKDNQPYVVWGQIVRLSPTPLISNIFWCTKTAIWSTPAPVSDLTFSYNPNICTDKNGVIHMVFTKRMYGTYWDSLYYSCFKNNSWSKVEKIDFNLSVAVDGKLNAFGNRLFMVFGANGNDLYFTSRSILTNVKDNNNEPAYDMSLTIYPNPFNSETTIRYVLKSSGRAEIKLYDILGKEIRTILDEEKSSGMYETHLNVSDLTSGIYFCRLRINNQNLFIKFLIIK